MADTPGVFGGVLRNHSAANYDNDGTPQVQVIETDDNIESIFEHRLLAKDRSILNASSLFNHPLNQSSFLDLDDGASEFLYSKSSERDRVALE